MVVVFVLLLVFVMLGFVLLLNCLVFCYGELICILFYDLYVSLCLFCVVELCLALIVVGYDFLVGLIHY